MAEQDLNDPLVLEHMMGFNGDCKESVQFHPVDTDVMISYTGCLLVISKVTDPHDQEFLRGHNEAVTCLAISPSGNLIASGQTSTTRVPNSEATVIVWDYATRQPVYRLMELHDGIQFSRNKVVQLAFSPDEKFLAGADDQHGGPKMAIWHTETAQLATMDKSKLPLSFIQWGEMTNAKRPAYTVLGAAGDKLNKYTLSWEVAKMQYKIESTTFALPSTGFTRGFKSAKHSIFTDKKNKTAAYLLAGTATGELAVFGVDTQVYRAAVPVGKGGLVSLAITPQGSDGSAPLAYCGCGDGMLKILMGGDLEWVALAEKQLDGAVLSLTISANGAELLAGTSTGNIYRLRADTLANLDMSGAPLAVDKPLLASHAKPIDCIAFGDSSEWFLTASESGTMRKWELSQYSVEYEIAPPTKTTDASAVTRALCLAVKRQLVLSGWSDGVIRAYEDDTGKPLWQITSAHRGGVSCIDLTPLYLVSGGVDGAIRIWEDGHSKKIVGNFDEHKKAVTGLCVDRGKPSLVHSCSEDKSVVTIDLDQARRVASHTVKEGAFKSMAQISTHELELVSGDTAGCLKFWDIDEADPVSLKTTWHPQDEPTKERRLTHVDVSPPMPNEDGSMSAGSDYLLACTASGDVQVWEMAGVEARLLSIGAAHSEEVTMARFSPDAKQIVSVGKDACICVWNFFA